MGAVVTMVPPSRRHCQSLPAIEINIGRNTASSHQCQCLPAIGRNIGSNTPQTHDGLYQLTLICAKPDLIALTRRRGNVLPCER